jgi:hypothetical protein
LPAVRTCSATALPLSSKATTFTVPGHISHPSTLSDSDFWCIVFFSNPCFLPFIKVRHCCNLCKQKTGVVPSRPSQFQCGKIWRVVSFVFQRLCINKRVWQTKLNRYWFQNKNSGWPTFIIRVSPTIKTCPNKLTTTHGLSSWSTNPHRVHLDQLQASNHKKKTANLDILHFFLNHRKFINPLEQLLKLFLNLK